MTEIARELARARAMLDVGRYDEAASLLGQIVAADPGDSRAWCLLAVAHLGTGDYQGAVAGAGRAAALAPSDDWPQRLVSTAQARMGNVQAAVRAANEACRLAPDEWRAWLCLAQAPLAPALDHAQAEVKANLLAAAEQAAANARRLAPEEPGVHHVSGRVSFAKEQWKAARAHQERALSLDPAHSGALNELGRISLKRRKAARAAGHFVQAARSAPGITAYGRNVEAAVRSLVYRVMYLAAPGCWALALVTVNSHSPRAWAVAGLCAIMVSSIALAVARLRGMPPAARALLRTRRIVLALSVVYGSMLIGVIIASVAPATALPAALAAVAVLVVVSRFAAYAILRRKT